MAGEWPQVSIEWIAKKSKGAIAIGPFGSRMKSGSYTDAGIPVIRGTNLTGGKSFSGNFVYIDEQLADKLGSCNVYRNDLVFPHRGAIGEVGIVSDASRYILSSSMMKLTCDDSKACADFMFYFFKSHKGRHELLKNSSQVGTPGIGQPLSSLRSIRLNLPPVCTQKAISKILTTLDNKIELNRQTNQTLEAMAQALFKSWFVDFDPVIDNALAAGNDIPEPLKARAAARQALGDARKPLPEEIRREFPDGFEFVDEMGWVPRGWPVCRFKDAMELLYGKSLPARDRLAGAFPVYGSGGVSSYHAKGLVAGPGIVVGRKGTVGSVYWVGEDFYPIDTVFYVQPLGIFPLSYIHRVLLRTDIKSMGADSAVPGVNRNALYATPILKASEILLLDFQSKSNLMREKRDNLELEIQTLTKLRDTLLPKLLSGELTIPDAEKLVADAV